MNPIDALRRIPAFRDFARAKMAVNPASWHCEAEHGSGIMKAVAMAVVEIGGDSQ